MKSNSLNDEKELLLRLKNGDRPAFTELYHRYKSDIALRLFSLLKIDELVEDALQELFFKIWNNRKQIDPDQPFAGYLFRISTYLSYDHFRKLARDKKVEAALSASQPDQFKESYQKEMDEALYALIDRLPLQRKKVFMLCKFDGKSYQEVGSELNISVNSVKDHIVKANQFLKQNYHHRMYLASAYIALSFMSHLV